MNKTSNFLAIDLGASGGRVVNGMWDGSRFELKEIHRFANAAICVPGGLYWDVLGLWHEIKEGMARYRREYNGGPVSVGLDAWGVDFAFLDPQGRLLGNPHSHRDHRTIGVPEALFQCIPKHELFCKTGNQPWRINTIVQLFSMVQNQDPQLRSAHTLLMLPDLFSYWMTGEKRVELTEAATSGMLQVTHPAWAPELLKRLGIPVSLLPDIVRPGAIIAPLKRNLIEEVGFDAATRAVAVASHDTASAVAGIPGMDGETVFISCGTWSLMGIKANAPVTTPEALMLGFTNELDACGKALLLRNITGLWLLQECLRKWRHQAWQYSWESLIQQAGEELPFRAILDPDDAQFLAPDDMTEAIREYCVRTRQPIPETPAATARCCLESLSLRYRQVLESLELISGRRFSKIRIVGGGCKNRLLCQWTANACCRTVIAGPAEATALGNIVMQAVAAGRLGRPEDAWDTKAPSYGQMVFEPHSISPWDEAYERFKRLGQ